MVRPVGPDGERTYWARRIVVLLAAAVVLGVLVWVLWPKNDGTVATTPSTPTPTASSPEPETTPTEDETDSPEPEPTGETTEPDPDPTPTEEPATESPAAEEPSPTSTELAGCKPDELRVTLTGPPTVAAGKAVEFELSIINGGETPCALKVNADNLELKVYSGTDRIWTTNHCTEWVPAIGADLEPEAATTWTMVWPAKRSAAECTIRDHVLQAGTYVATAQLDGAKPVQHVMNLR